MTSHSSTSRRPAGQVLAPAAAIGGLSVVLVAGLKLLRVLDRADAAISRAMSRGGAQAYPKHLPDAVLWLATVFLAFALAFAILATPGQWRRVVLWVTAVVLIGAWAPVLSLASHAPAISAPWIATIWSGVCALVYAANHRMSSDSPTPDAPR